MKSKRKYRSEYCQIVEDWRKSGISRVDYCNQHSYVASTFDGWIKKSMQPTGDVRSKSSVKRLNKGSDFISLKIENSPHGFTNPTFELHYPNGVILGMSTLPTTEELSRIIHLYRPGLCSR